MITSLIYWICGRLLSWSWSHKRHTQYQYVTPANGHIFTSLDLTGEDDDHEPDCVGCALWPGSQWRT